jgi:hypothetical protein
MTTRHITETIEIHICNDCAMWHANGDLTMIEDIDRVAEIKACNAPVIVDPEDDEDCYSYFYSPCGACGSRRLGTRTRAWLELEIELKL